MMRVDARKGSITAGKDADIVLFDEDIQIKLVMARGDIYRNDLQ